MEDRVEELERMVRSLTITLGDLELVVTDLQSTVAALEREVDRLGHTNDLAHQKIRSLSSELGRTRMGW